MPNHHQSRNRPRRSGEQGRQDGRAQFADALPALQPAQIEEAGGPVLMTMRNGTQPQRSVAAELALLYLREIEARLADEPDLLVSTEAVLSFATIKSADAAEWERWRVILDQYDKTRLIEYM